jgi:hypothetical protein
LRVAILYGFKSLSDTNTEHLHGRLPPHTNRKLSQSALYQPTSKTLPSAELFDLATWQLRMFVQWPSQPQQRLLRAMSKRRLQL